MRIAVAVSGGGSNLQALLDALPAGSPARVALVLSNTPKAGGLARAEQRGVPTAVFQDPANGAEWLALLEGHGIDLIVLAGYLKLVPREVIAEYSHRIINIHPALLPEFGGPGMYGKRVHQAVLDARRTESGCTVHLVDEEYDRGEILAQARVPVLPDDTAESLAARVLAEEHRLLPEVVLDLASRSSTYDPRP
ncbi:MAG TPA: phosphoribosylglycinamide formyltransferase [Gemmatimonadales bacterium]|nr:phosphoribosylglycinamide formyltransferase [Gemmatimonadales bacterium]